MQKFQISIFALNAAFLGLILPENALAQSRNIYPSAPAPRQDVNQDTRRLVQDLTSQQAVSLIYASNLANARENLLITQNNQKDRQIRTLIAENRRALRAASNNEAEKRRLEQSLSQSQTQLDEVITERDNLTREIINRDNEAKQQIESYEAAIKKVALSDDPRIIAYLERFAAGDNAAIDEFVSYARAQHEIRRHLNDIEFAEQLRVGAAQKNTLRILGQATLADVIPLYREAYDLDNNDFRGAVYLARLYTEKGDRRNALEIYQKLLPITQDDIYKIVLYNDMGDILSEYDKPQAIDAYRNAYNLAQEYLRQAPQENNRKSWMVISATHLADEIVLTNKTEAIQMFENALNLTRAMVASEPENIDYKENLMMVLDRYSDALRFDDITKAISLREEGLSIERQVLAQNEGNIKYQNGLVIFLQSLGDMYISQDVSKAVEYYLESITEAEKLVAIDGDLVESKRMLALNYTKVGDLFNSFDSGQNAYDAYYQALEIQRKNVEHEPDNFILKRDLCATLLSIAELGQDTKPEDVKEFIEEANNIIQSDYSLNSSDNKVKFLYASVNLRYGIILANLNEAGAKDKLVVAINTFEAIKPYFSQNKIIDYGIGLANWRLGKVELKNNDITNANQHYNNARTIFENIAQELPNTYSVLLAIGDLNRDVSLAFENGNDIETAKSFANIALAKYQTALLALPKSRTLHFRILNAYLKIANLTNSREAYQATKDFADVMKQKNLLESTHDAAYQELVTKLREFDAAPNAAPNAVQH